MRRSSGFWAVARGEALQIDSIFRVRHAFVEFGGRRSLSEWLFTSDLHGQTSLYEFFGYFGLFCSTILVMRVLISILRDGLN